VGLQERIQSVIDDKFHGNKAAFARAVYVDPTGIAKWSDEHPPRHTTIKRIEKGAKVHGRWVLDGIGERDIPEAETGLSADACGPWGITRQEEGAGVPHTVTEFTPPSGSAPEISKAVQMLSTIFVSGDDVLTRAIMSNLIAFSRSAERDKAHVERIRNLEAKCSDLMERLEAVEKRLGTPTPRPMEGAGASKK
jgi:hypothetical protein